MADGGLSVEVNATDDDSVGDGDGDAVYQADEVEVDDDAALRAQAKINSPKGKNAIKFDNDNNNELGSGGAMSLNIGDVNEDEDDKNVTPNTKRDQMGINSPRQKNKQNWTQQDEDASNAAVASLVTQVSRNDPNLQTGGGGVESLVTQVQREDEIEKNIQQQQTQSSGFCACFSCLWSCCSGPQPPEPVQMQSTSMTKTNNDINTTYVSSGDGTKQTMMTTTSTSTANTANTNNQTAKPIQKDNPKERLIDEHKQGTTSGNDNEESVSSSTEYDVSLLPPLKPEHIGKKCLVLDLDETLVHSSFKPIPKPDFIIPVEIDRVVHHVYVLKRPYVDEFLLRASKHYELVVFTASLSKYADPLLDKLDIHNVITHRLFRESCVIHGTAYVKDLRKLGRKLKDSIIVDNSPPSYLFQTTNAVPITSWFDDQNDTQLLDFCPVLETTMKDIDDVRKILDANNKSFRWLCNQAHQPLSKFTIRNDQQH